MSIPTDVATRLVDAIVSRDDDRLLCLLAPDIWFRALVPGGAVEHHSAPAVVETIAAWFGNTLEFQAEPTSPVREIGNRVRVGWRASVLREAEPDQWRVVEQVGYCKVVGGAVGRLDIVCSGFQSYADSTSSSRHG